MTIMNKIARRHNFRILLHEKPFKGVNGSGKHNNWSLGTDTGVNLLGPGKTPSENLQFITFLVNVMAAVYRHNGLLKASIMSATNAHRLGANEAPPAIISTFLGAQISAVLEKLEASRSDAAITFSAKNMFKMSGISHIPTLMLDNTDRNRTSPFAFTGNRFEFRAVGSSDNCADAMLTLNTAVAEQLTRFKKAVDRHIESGMKKEKAIYEELKKLIRECKPIHFDGNGYSDEWKAEAARRGLDCELGRWAINTGPRNMISENLRRAGFSSGCWLLEIGVENGEELAKHTLNSHLGIMGGISLLGTTGLVRPYSHEAYIATIRICVRSTRLSGFRKAVFCTGGRTAALAKTLLPEYPSISFICIGDFIAESLQSAGEQGMTEAVVACMPGKLCKYAAGFANTHAHKVAQDMPLFLRTAERHAPLSGEARRGILACSSVRQALSLTPEEAHLSIYRDLAAEAQRQFQRHVPGLPVRFLISGFSGNLLLDIPPCHP